MQKMTHSFRYAAVNDAGRVIGEQHHSAKLSDADVDLILDLRTVGLSYQQIADKFDDPDGPTVTKQMVMLICQGKRRCQTVMGHKRVPLRDPIFFPADLSEFDIIGGF